jgi:hypothetical protein
MVNPLQERSYEDLTVAQARALRTDQARLAASYADRAAQAHASGSRAATAHWTAAYKRSAVRCRALGQLIRGELEQPRSAAAKANRAASGSYRPMPLSIAPRDTRGAGKNPAVATGEGTSPELMANSGLSHGEDVGVESERFVPQAGVEDAVGADRLTRGDPHPGDDRLLRLSAVAQRAAGVRSGDLLAATEGRPHGRRQVLDYRL